MLLSQKFGVSPKCVWRICLLIAFWVPNMETKVYQCKLCDASFKSCAMQYPQHNLTDDDCRMKVYKVGSQECSSLPLFARNSGETSGKMVLQAYYYKYDSTYSQTAFNVSFMDFSWKRITMRFTMNGKPENNSCRVFEFSDKFLSKKPSHLFYDCLWALSDYEGHTFTFEYEAQDDASITYRKSVFKVPPNEKINPINTNVEKRQVFVYVDITDNPLVILRVQTLPDTFNVYTYNVKAFSGTEMNRTVKEDKNITVGRGVKEFIFEWNFGIFPGNYFFEVRPVGGACSQSECEISRSPDIKIEASSTLYVAAGASVVIMLVLVITVFFKYVARDKTVSGRPKLLFIYRPTHATHLKVILELAQHLKKNYNIEAMVDELDINKSKTKDPFYWYNDAIDQSNFIAFVSSPTCCNAIDSIFPEVYKMALGLLKEKVFIRKPLSNTCNMMVFMLPYCSEKSLPQEAKNISLRFRIPSDINGLVDYIHNFQRSQRIGRLYYGIRYFFFRCALRDRGSLKKCPALNAAIHEASGEVKKCLKKDNRTDIKIEMDKKIPESKYSGGLHEPLEQPSSSTNRVSVSSVCSLPYRCFPGNIENYNLLGEESEIVEAEESQADNRTVPSIHGLTL